MGDVDDRVDPPRGPRPEALTWPFELAQRACEAIETEIRELEGCSSTHEGLVSGLLPQWIGRSCDEFTAGLEHGLHTLVARRRQLHQDLEDLRDAIGRAEQARQQRQADVAAWDRQMREHERSIRSQGGAIPR